MTTKYILYCGQLCNFQTRSMLIPIDSVISNKNICEHFDVLRKHAKITTLIGNNGDKYEIDNLIIVDYKSNKEGFMKSVDSPYGYAVHSLTSEAEWGNIKGAYYNLCSGFNNVKNYITLRSKTSYKNKPIDIVEGFLALESRDGKMLMPPVDTVKEMFDKFYPDAGYTNEGGNNEELI